MAIAQGSVSDNTFHMILCDIPMCEWEYYNSGQLE